MGQQDVFDLLKEFKIGLTSREIHKKLNQNGQTIGLGTVTNNLRKLVKGKIVIRYYPNGNIPKYILQEKATKRMIEQISVWDL